MDRDNEWIHTLYLQLYEKLFRAAYRLMGSPESAEDLVQQTFLLALFQGEALRTHPCPEGWLMKALHNLAMNERRRAARQQEVPLDALFDQAQRRTVRRWRSPFPGGSLPRTGRSCCGGSSRVWTMTRSPNVWGFQRPEAAAGYPGPSGGAGSSGTGTRGGLIQNRRERSNFCIFPLWGRKSPVRERGIKLGFIFLICLQQFPRFTTYL